MSLSALRRRTSLGLCAATLLTTAGGVVVGLPARAATVTVATDGSGDYKSVAAAVNAVASGSTITVKKGTYTGQVIIPAGKSITLQGATGNPKDVVITANSPQGNDGTNHGATMVNRAAGTTVKALTVANTYGSGTQALALFSTGDKQVYDNVRLTGRQDTYYANSGRVYVVNSYIEGDTDFIYGAATLVIDKSTIYSLNRNSSNNGYITAASTPKGTKYGFLITNSTLSSNAAAGTVALGRCWHPGNDANASGQVLIRDSSLGAHIRQSGAWVDMSGFSWKTCRFTEYNNSGSGKSNGTADRPMLAASSAGDYTAQKYLAGSDGWNPTR